MKQLVLSRVSSLIVLVCLVLSAAGSTYATSTPSARGAVNTTAGAHKIFLPLVNNISLAPQSVFGVEISKAEVQAVASRAGEARLAWTRYNGIVWSDIEPTRGAPDFSKLSLVDAELRELSRQGVRPIVVVRGAPAWAQQRPPYSCGAIHSDALPDFARFMRQIVARYSAHPYNVQYWEFGNEVDVDPSLVGQDSVYGCWGDNSDQYYGGGKYGEMLKAIYPSVKQANPEAQVVFGGLLLDCDVTRDGNACKPANFLEGALRAGAASAFDVMAYHGYTFWHDSLPTHDWDLNDAQWGHRGGKVLGKLNFVREVMNRYGANKPIMMNEGGLICSFGATCSENIRSIQANYAVRLYTRSIANNLTASIWYTLNGPGWNNSGLLDAAQAPRPAYNTIKWMSIRLAGGQFAGTLATGKLEGYAIRNRGKTYRVYWTNDGSTVPMPVYPGTVYNMYGQQITYNGTVGFEPIFVESDA